MRVFILTLFPAAVEAYIASGIMAIARRKRLIDLRLVNFRQFGKGRHRTVDDRPFGGGPGMVIKPEPIFECVEWIEREHGRFHKILLTPAGVPFHQARARVLARCERLLLLCGRYEGFDERIREGLDWEEISLGDFVLCGGEIAALAVVEALARLVPGVLGDEESTREESFSAPVVAEARDRAERAGSMYPGLEYPQYTRPREYRGMKVPDVLLSGDHGAIRSWRRSQGRKLTENRRPDLLDPVERRGRPRGAPPEPEH